MLKPFGPSCIRSIISRSYASDYDVVADAFAECKPTNIYYISIPFIRVQRNRTFSIERGVAGLFGFAKGNYAFNVNVVNGAENINTV